MFSSFKDDSEETSLTGHQSDKTFGQKNCGECVNEIFIFSVILKESHDDFHKVK